MSGGVTPLYYIFIVWYLSTGMAVPFTLKSEI